MPERYRWSSRWLAMNLCRPDMEHLLCLIIFSLISIIGLFFWTYEDEMLRGTGRLRREDAVYENIIESFVMDERRLMEERAAQKFAEFPEIPEHEDVPDVLQRHRERSGFTQGPLEKSDRVLKKINRNFKSKRKRQRARGNAKRNGQRTNATRKDLLGNVHGGEAFCKLYNAKPEIKEDFECIRISFKPAVPICLYPEAVDIHVSYHLRNAGVWEPHILRHFQNLLYNDPELGVYDIGANIGQYSLLAATMGRSVVAVEPYLPSLRRIHKAIKLGKLEDKIILIQNAVSDRRDTFELFIPPDNQGGISLTSQDADRFCTEPECPPHATTIVMDDLLEVTNFEKAVMKIDIEGHEHRAFVQSLRLLQTVDIQYIIMEWIKLRSYYGSEADESIDKSLVFELIDYLVEMGYTPRGSLLLNRLDPRYWYGWPDDIFWEADDTKKKRAIPSNRTTNRTLTTKEDVLSKSSQRHSVENLAEV